MTKKEEKEDLGGLDDLSLLQKSLDELGEKFYTYIGIIQRDAPPISRPPEELDEVAADETARKELLTKTPGFAREIVAGSRAIDALITSIEQKMSTLEGKEESLLESANFESRQAGEEMAEAVDDAQKLLANVRDIIAARETEG